MNVDLFLHLRFIHLQVIFPKKSNYKQNQISFIGKVHPYYRKEKLIRDPILTE